ncbi:MAG: 50S ribosomal protein L11 methyltransferase [Flavobacteriaceae bacterium]|nr:50S ribosomal protein L11 methyltransferase [Flavobacteriaceae bacterium]
MPKSCYIVFKFVIAPLYPGNEILVAQLSNLGFEGFIEKSDGIEAYIMDKYYKESLLEEVQILRNTKFSIQFSFKKVEPINWNSKWESSYDPVIVNNKCIVKAPFHQTFGYDYEIIIHPKMSFGTGHHETTNMMIQLILNTQLLNKSVLDVGCGTAILSILAEKRGAQSIHAVDIDEWSYENSLENIKLNKCKKINVFKGDIFLVKHKKFDVIMANINRNILLEQIPQYVSCLNDDGFLFLSGFFEDDISKFKLKIASLNLTLCSKISKNGWVAIKLKKNNDYKT